MFLHRYLKKNGYLENPFGFLHFLSVTKRRRAAHNVHPISFQSSEIVHIIESFWKDVSSNASLFVLGLFSLDIFFCVYLVARRLSRLYCTQKNVEIYLTGTILQTVNGSEFFTFCPFIST